MPEHLLYQENIVCDQHILFLYENFLFSFSFERKMGPQRKRLLLSKNVLEMKVSFLAFLFAYRVNKSLMQILFSNHVGAADI